MIQVWRTKLKNLIPFVLFRFILLCFFPRLNPYVCRGHSFYYWNVGHVNVVGVPEKWRVDCFYQDGASGSVAPLHAQCSAVRTLPIRSYRPCPLVANIDVRSSKIFQLTKELEGILFGTLGCYSNVFLMVPPLLARCLDFGHLWSMEGFHWHQCHTHLYFSSHNIWQLKMPCWLSWTANNLVSSCPT